MKIHTLLLLLTSAVVATTHYLALEFYLYWRYWWFDIPMHLLGGVVVALLVLAARDFVPRLPKPTLLLTLALVLIVAVGWEVFEWYFGIAGQQPTYLIDTSLDLLMGLTGGTVGYFLGKITANL